MAQASDTAQPQTPPRRDNTATVTGTNRLKALSHPTRLRILTVMSDTKPVTVGTVSYHLKQLEKAGFVTQTPSPDGDNRRSCWLAAQSRLEINADAAVDSAMATTMDQVSSTFRQEAWQRYRSASDNLPKQWTDPTVTSSSVLRLTSEEYARMSQELRELFNTWTSRDLAHEEGDGSQPVMLNIDAFRWLP